MAICNKCGQDNRSDAKFCKGCGGTIQGIISVEPLDTGAMIENRYKILKRIKVGGMGAVYKAHDLRLDAIWAIKELLPNSDMLSKEQSQATDWFMREAKLLAKVDHPNIPKVTDYFISNGRYYLVMTYIEGEDVELILKRQPDKKMPPDVVIDWAKQLLKVLDYLHNLTPPVVYRDIKPANFMLNKDGRIMLIDFGIARTVQDSQTQKTAIGTSGYAPLEQYQGKPEPRSDIYALGATMHHLLTGIQPLPFKFEKLNKLIPSINPRLQAIIEKALEPNARDRFTCAADMLEALTTDKPIIKTSSKGLPALKKEEPPKQQEMPKRIEVASKESRIDKLDAIIQLDLKSKKVDTGETGKPKIKPELKLGVDEEEVIQIGVKPRKVDTGEIGKPKLKPELKFGDEEEVIQLDVKPKKVDTEEITRPKVKPELKLAIDEPPSKTEKSDSQGLSTPKAKPELKIEKFSEGDKYKSKSPFPPKEEVKPFKQEIKPSVIKRDAKPTRLDQILSQQKSKSKKISNTIKLDNQQLDDIINEIKMRGLSAAQITSEMAIDDLEAINQQLHDAVDESQEEAQIKEEVKPAGQDLSDKKEKVREVELKSKKSEPQDKKPSEPELKSKKPDPQDKKPSEPELKSKKPEPQDKKPSESDRKEKNSKSQDKKVQEHETKPVKEEITYQDEDVIISNVKITIDKSVYKLSDINYAEACLDKTETEKSSSGNIIKYIIIAAGLIAFIAISLIFRFSSMALNIVSGVILLITIITAILTLFGKKQENTFNLNIITSSGKKTILQADDEKYIKKLVDNISQAGKNK